MVVTINNDNGASSYDVSLVEDIDIKNQATVIINKVGSLEILLEALNFTSSTHRANLESLLRDCPEALVEVEEEETEVLEMESES